MIPPYFYILKPKLTLFKFIMYHYFLLSSSYIF
nr:MAG TPA: hypothetical protein [Caudoviricetes sp.]DAX74288.1 MAG TPA: hypothetical protein [Caudoviricetes sp.]